MLPENVKDKAIKAIISRETHEYRDEYNLLLENNYSKDDIDKMLITQQDRKKALENMGIKGGTFYEYYKNYAEESPKEYYDPIFSLDEIHENYQNPHPLYAQYPQIGKRYLQISSAEGEHSYFYDKETDAVYSVDWSQLDDLNSGKLKPMFNSFYDFLEWYYSEDEES